MSIKLKALGLGILAALAIGAVVVMSASAESQPQGHFTSEVANPTLKVDDGVEPHRLQLAIEGLTGIVCDKPSYVVTWTDGGTTTKDITAEPTYETCHTTGSAKAVPIKMNGCKYTFTQPNKESAKTEHTVDLTCPAGQKVVIEHEGCVLEVHPQNGLKGVGYTTLQEEVGGKKIHAITMTLSVSFIMTVHNFPCNLILPTEKVNTLSGSVTVTGFNGAARQSITATGSVN